MDDGDASWVVRDETGLLVCVGCDVGYDDGWLSDDVSGVE
jgi:hypothetical protein